MLRTSVVVVSGQVLAAVAGSLFIAGLVNAHGGSLNQQALDACMEKQRSQGCQYQGHHNDLYIGTCQYVSEDDLLCVRNKPIQQVDPKVSPSDSHHGEQHPVGSD